MNISELYQQPAKEVTFELQALSRHIPAPCYSEFNKKIEIRELDYQQFDHRRSWRLATVWFEGKPFGVIQNAGRDGRDYVQAFWTDRDIYKQAMLYLYALDLEEEPPELTSLDFDEPELLDFYRCGYKPGV